mmetsp:Transcript_20789/g.30733  ORF Transcript_20789/g.30733 Transcript_20789/m.30733 type:complete len:369 (-) Transcript_20789:220-1326(-)
MSQELQQIYKVRSYRKDCGKKIKSSKRTLTWRFGLAKERGGILKGKRKKEHEITLIWSVASGKRIVLLDGLQRHYSQGVWIKDTFQRRWNWKGVSIEMIAHSTRPAGGVDLQYDLKLNGTSFHLLPEEDEPVAVKQTKKSIKKSTHAKNPGSERNPSKFKQNRDTIGNTATKNYPSVNTVDQSVWTTPPSLDKTDTLDMSEVASFFDSPSVKEEGSLHSFPPPTSKMSKSRGDGSYSTQSSDSRSDSDCTSFATMNSSVGDTSFATMNTSVYTSVGDSRDDSVDDSVNARPMEHVKTINRNEMREILKKSKSTTASQKVLMKNSPDEGISLSPSSLASDESEDGFMCSVSFQACGKFTESKLKLDCCF